MTGETNPAWLLAIETSHQHGSVAAGDAASDRPPHTIWFPEGLVHGRELVPAIAQCLEDLEVARDQLAVIAVSGGPGSYTGVRVGVSAAKAIAWALSIPVLKISSLETIAHAAHLALPKSTNVRSITTVVDARRGSAYHAEFRLDEERLARATSDSIRPVSEIFADIGPDAILAGSGARTLPGAAAYPAAPPDADAPGAEHAYAIARQVLIDGGWLTTRGAEALPPEAHQPHELNPTYLRPSEAEEKRAQREG